MADGHRIFAEALATALAAEPDVEVSAAGSGAGAERALERAVAEARGFQVMLVDADLGAGAPGSVGVVQSARVQVPGQRRGPGSAAPVPPAVRPAGQGGDGIALISRVRAVHPDLRVIVLASADDPHRAVRALQAGAGGWVAKESSLGRLMAVIRGVMRDETHVPPSLLTGVIQELTAARRDRTESERLVDTLTPREKQVLRCMVAGLGRQAVADRLYLSPHTVRTHMQNVLGKLGVHSTLAAVALARRAGVGPVEA
ncbi:DNA-binding response regulator, NarL/FixJ family, contains REC and HTH domains [Streptacidiphilus jiangxiensis]|uniref:DNA-binding response regulator, NarL/FixJ family, contains REC and HTH domains n=1 Tax=Streptacidiphilus jiangxiensis TaxID=235985 RepID=A0A1H7FFM4_STRJI|nr:DNA-binding response regulator, NarL/FixJ family, contains REC and HTH domains [Streptacidiphilus jiangxiensis]